MLNHWLACSLVGELLHKEDRCNHSAYHKEDSCSSQEEKRYEPSSCHKHFHLFLTRKLHLTFHSFY